MQYPVREKKKERRIQKRKKERKREKRQLIGMHAKTKLGEKLGVQSGYFAQDLLLSHIYYGTEIRNNLHFREIIRGNKM